MLDSILDELASDPQVQGAGRAARRVPGTIAVLGVPWTEATDAPLPTDLIPQQTRTQKSPGSRTWLTDLLLATGLGGFGAGMLAANKRKAKSLRVTRKLPTFGPRGV